MTNDDPLGRWFEGLGWTAAQFDAMAASQSRAAEARTAAFTREAFASLPVTTDPAQPHRCRYCRRRLAAKKRKDALYCSARCRDRAYRRRLHKAAQNAADLEWSLTFPVHADVRCVHCGVTLAPEMYRVRRSDRRYCSGKCRTRAWRARKASAKVVTDGVAVTDSVDA